jgi:two-component system response regulator (stage 0 sporulation protein F)
MSHSMKEPGRILIVDDEAPVREVLNDYFVERGYVVFMASNGEEALAAFTREGPDVVLLDVRMPGIDGMQVLKRLREADPDVPVIMVTANEDLETARETLSIGAFDYVAKPFDFEHLNRTVVAAIVHSGGTPLGDSGFGATLPDPWSRLVTEVFRSVRGMDREARASTGVRLEDAALAAAREAMAGRLAEATSHLTEIKLLVAVASSLGDLPASGRAVIDGALETAEAALPLR